MGESDRDPHHRHDVDWKAERERIDLAVVATNLLGPAQGRRGEHGRRLWWLCPFHEDRNPSFCVELGKAWWKCYGCDAHGDAADLVMRLKRVTFLEAVAYLTGGPAPTTPGKAPGRPRDERPVGTPSEPSGLPEADAVALVADAYARLWSDEGADALAYLTGPRCLALDTIRAARLGWTPGVMVPKRDGNRSYRVLGWVIPWFNGDRLAKVNVRQPGDRERKYLEAYRNPAALTCYPSPATIRPGRPLVVVEGEFDALALGEVLGELAAVVTLGSASNGPTADILTRLPSVPRLFIATDADGPGDKAAARWPARGQRVRPPEPFKDWTEARQGGVDLRLWWWRDILPGVGRPPLFSWDDLAGRRWGPAGDDPTPGVVVP
jgi:DNA primase